MLINVDELLAHLDIKFPTDISDLDTEGKIDHSKIIRIANTMKITNEIKLFAEFKHKQEVKARNVKSNTL